MSKQERRRTRFAQHVIVSSILALVSFCATPMAFAQSTAPDSELAQLINYPPTQNDWIQEVRRLLQRPAWTARDLAWQLNTRPSARYITFILFDSSQFPFGMDNRYAANCGNVPSQRVIYCDVATIRRFATEMGFDQEWVPSKTDKNGDIFATVPQPISPDAMRPLYMTTLDWVITHELGHLVARHAGETHFLPPADVRSNAQAESSQCHAHELEADSFVLNMFPELTATTNGKHPLQRDIPQLLTRVVRAELIHAQCDDQRANQPSMCPGLAYGVGGMATSGTISIRSPRSHPAFLVRALSLLARIPDGHFYVEQVQYDDRGMYGGDAACH